MIIISLSLLSCINPCHYVFISQVMSLIISFFHHLSYYSLVSGMHLVTLQHHST